MKRLWLMAAIAMLFGAAQFVWAAELPAPAERKVDFARDVRPLLAAQYWKCHGALDRRILRRFRALLPCLPQIPHRPWAESPNTGSCDSSCRFF